MRAGPLRRGLDPGDGQLAEEDCFMREIWVSVGLEEDEDERESVCVGWLVVVGGRRRRFGEIDGLLHQRTHVYQSPYNRHR